MIPIALPPDAAVAAAPVAMLRDMVRRFPGDVFLAPRRAMTGAMPPGCRRGRGWRSAAGRRWWRWAMW